MKKSRYFLAYFPGILVGIWCIMGCQTEGLSPSEQIRIHLHGQWEAEYYVNESDTIFYELASSFPCAYSLLEFSYSSGFLLTEENHCHIFWCNQNLEFVVPWQLNESKIAFIDDQAREWAYQFEFLSDSAIIFYHSENEFFLLKRE